MTEPAEVSRLPYEAQPAPPPSRPGRLHGMAIVGLAGSAVAGIVLTLTLITVGWPEEARRTLIVLIAISVIAFMVSAALAVFAAARDTYPARSAAPGGKTREQ